MLREGGTLGILSDLNTQTREGVFVPFFGKLACTTAGIATLALEDRRGGDSDLRRLGQENESATFFTATRRSSWFEPATTRKTLR